jgi:pyruvate/2-oxoglutarate dehydrogenase complex dihydrolipoamide acyltransferase (E2) component
VILDVGNTLRTAVPIDGKITIRKITDLTIAVDARVVPEPTAAKFLARIAELLQDPSQISH